MLCTIIVFLAAAAGFAHAAAFLAAEIIQRLTFDISLMADSNNNIFFGYQVFNFHGRRINGKFRAACVAELFLHFKQIFFYNAQNFMFVCQNTLQPVNGFQNIYIFIINLFALQTGQPLQAHIQNGLCLALAEAEFFHQRSFGSIGIGAAADSADYFIKMVKRYFQAFQNMGAFFGLAEFISCTAGNNIFLMFQIII